MAALGRHGVAAKEGDEEFMKELFGLILAIAVLIFLITAYNYGSLIFWGTKFQNADRQIFENTKSFRDGSARDLDNLRLSYLTAKTPEEKSAIKDTMRHRALGVPREQISPEINSIIYGAE